MFINTAFCFFAWCRVFSVPQSFSQSDPGDNGRQLTNENTPGMYGSKETYSHPIYPNNPLNSFEAKLENFVEKKVESFIENLSEPFAKVPSTKINSENGGNIDINENLPKPFNRLRPKAERNDENNDNTDINENSPKLLHNFRSSAESNSENSDEIGINKNSHKLLDNLRSTAEKNDENSGNVDIRKILKETDENDLLPSAQNVYESKCTSPTDQRCLRKVKRRKMQILRNNANIRRTNEVGTKQINRIRNNLTVPNINTHQLLNDGKSNSASKDKNELTTKVGSHSCACYWRQEECGCNCKGTLNYDDFQDVTKSFFPCHNFTFLMAEGEFYALPPNFFSKIKSVQHFNLFITNSTFEYICDPTPMTSPFKGVLFEKSAQIKLTNVNVRRGWNWTPFEQLMSASGAQLNMTLENCQLRRLTSDFANLAGGHVDVIDINNSDLEMVGSNAFGTFENMTRFRVPRNKIQQLRRTDFPQLLFKLEELDLRNNELSFLDNDLFTNMPSLKEILLSGNPISVLPEATFQAVISKAELVGISDIPLTCDCRLQWLKDSMKNDNVTKKNMKGAICRRPPYLRGTPFDLLSKEHLICPSTYY